MAVRPLPSEGSVSAWFHHTGENGATAGIRAQLFSIPTRRLAI